MERNRNQPLEFYNWDSNGMSSNYAHRPEVEITPFGWRVHWFRFSTRGAQPVLVAEGWGAITPEAVKNVHL